MTDTIVANTPDSRAEVERGKELHREFVGMLFALAIAQVAVEAATIVNSQLSSAAKAPALFHLLLAVLVIATSWVGWGRSAYSLSAVRSAFTFDFVELLLDVWLVCIYFFLVHGAERIQAVAGVTTIEHASAAVEALWVGVMFVTYLLWDLWTKRKERTKLVQRGWASLACALLAGLAFIAFSPLRGSESVIWADLSLISLVLLFRAMKLHDLSAHPSSSWVRIAALLAAGVVLGLLAVRA